MCKVLRRNEKLKTNGDSHCRDMEKVVVKVAEEARTRRMRHQLGEAWP